MVHLFGRSIFRQKAATGNPNENARSETDMQSENMLERQTGYNESRFKRRPIYLFSFVREQFIF